MPRTAARQPFVSGIYWRLPVREVTENDAFDNAQRTSTYLPVVYMSGSNESGPQNSRSVLGMYA